MKIEKNNICIRRATSQDAQNLNKWWNDGAIMVHVGFLDGLNESMETTLNTIHHILIFKIRPLIQVGKYANHPTKIKDMAQ